MIIVLNEKNMDSRKLGWEGYFYFLKIKNHFKILSEINLFIYIYILKINTFLFPFTTRY